jgi:disulfide bond formation protein DsbB
MVAMRAFIRKYQGYLPYVVWAVALTSMLGSLAMSEVFHLLPCVLCWYQRILMYPLVLIVGVGILRRDRGWVWYALPMAGLGVVVALYHSLLQWGIIPEAIAPCQVGLSCATKQIDWLGFVTIPFMSLLAFGAIALGTIGYAWATSVNRASRLD